MPNPASHNVMLMLAGFGSGKLKVKLYDLSGRCLADIITSSSLLNLDVSNFEKGVYMVKVESLSFSPIVQKLLVE
jgi:hypothetical protein